MKKCAIFVGLYSFLLLGVANAQPMVPNGDFSSVTNNGLRFGSVYALNVNGDFQIDQPNEGASLALGNGRMTDGWLSASTTGTDITFIRSTASVPSANFFTSGLFSYTGGGASPAAGDRNQVNAPINGKDVAQLNWGNAVTNPATLDVCVQGNASITYPASFTVFVNNNNAGGSYRSFLHDISLPAASTWVCVSIPIPGDSTASAWPTATSNNPASFILAGINLGCGSTFQSSTVDAWQAGRFYCTPSASNLRTAASSAITVTGFHFRLGAQNYALNPFQPLPYPLEYGRARQRYWKTFAVGTKPAQNAGAGTGEVQFPATALTVSTQRAQTVLFPNMAITPTVTYFNPSATNANCRDETAAGDGGAATSTNLTSTGVNVTCTGNAATAINNVMGVHIVADTGL